VRFLVNPKDPAAIVVTLEGIVITVKPAYWNAYSEMETRLLPP
jgi:hypothetical protein